MTKFSFFLTYLLFLVPFSSDAQTIGELRESINNILADKNATVGVSIIGMHPTDTLSINGKEQLPMQSVFKYHLALAVLDQVDEGKFTLNDSITVTKKHQDNNLWSPIRKKYPNGARLTLAKILKY